MNLISPKTLALVTVPVVFATIAWSGARYSTARENLRRSTAQHHAISTSAAELDQLRRAKPTIAAGQKPQPNISGHITDALVEAGLAPTLLTNLVPNADTPVEPASGTKPARTGNGRPDLAVRYRRQSARLTLDPLSMPELGRFLTSWREMQPDWIVASINVTPTFTTGARNQPPRGSSATAAGDEPEPVSPARPVRVSIVIECLYADVPPATAATSHHWNTSSAPAQ